MNRIIYILFLFTCLSYGQTIRYASVSGSGANNGTSLTDEWTLPQALANATSNTIVHVRKGNYPSGNYVQSNDGTSSNPIIFRSYNNTPNDISVTTTSSFNKNSPIDSNVSATLTPSNSNSWGVIIQGDYVTFENFQFSGGNFGIQIVGSNSGLKNCLVRDVGDLSTLAYSGQAVRLSGANSFAYNNTIVNAGAENLHVRDSANGAHLRYNIVACTNTANPTDYYIILTGVSGVIVEDNLVDRASGLSHQGHGAECKFNADNNIIRRNTIIGTFLVVNFGSDNNVFEDNNVDSHFNDIGNQGANATFGIRVGKNCTGNEFHNTYIQDTWVAVMFSSFDEGTGDANNAGFNNDFYNTVINNSRHFIGGDTFQNNGHPAYDNKFYHTTGYSFTGAFFNTARPLNGFEFYNTILTGGTDLVITSNSGSLNSNTLFSNLNISGSSVSASSFTPYNDSAITTITPSFTDAGNNDFSLTNGDLDIGLQIGSLTDFNGATRDSPYSLGAYEYGATTTPPDPEPEPTAFKSGDPMYFLKWINN